MNFVDRIIGDPNILNYVANGRARSKIDKISVIAFLRWRLAGTLTLASYTTAPTKLVESALNLISLFTVTAAGKAGGANGTIKAIDAPYSYQMTRLLESTAPTLVDVGTTNAAFAFESNGKLYFQNLLSANPNATLLDARSDRLSSLTVDVNFRDQTSMVTGGVAGTAVLSATGVTLQAREVLGVAMPPNSPWLKESQAAFNIVASKLNSKLTDLPVGNVLKRIVLKGTVGANDFSDPSDSVFNNTTPAEGPHTRFLVNNNFTPLDAIYQQLRADNKERFGVETMPTGYVVYQPVGSLDLRKAQRLDLVQDVNFTGSNTNTIQATSTEIVVAQS